MKKLIFTACMALFFSTISAQNDYIVKTSNSNKSTQMQLVEEDDELLESLGVEQDYIVQNFKYFFVCYHWSGFHNHIF